MVESVDVANEGSAPEVNIQAGMDWLLSMAEGLEQYKNDPAASLDEIQRIGRAQQSLNDLAGSLADRQIDILVDQLRITVDRINDALQYTDRVIQETADMRRHLGKVEALVVFLSTIPTENGNEILRAANNLRKILDA